MGEINVQAELDSGKDQLQIAAEYYDQKADEEEAKAEPPPPEPPSK